MEINAHFYRLRKRILGWVLIKRPKLFLFVVLYSLASLRSMVLLKNGI